MIQIKIFTFNPFQENTYLLYDEEGNCAIIDPGCFEEFERAEMLAFIEQHKLKPVLFLNTHCHIDHVLGNRFVHTKWGLPLQMHKDDLITLHSLSNYAHIFGVGNLEESPEPEIFLEEGDQLRLGKHVLDIVFVPGHAPGHIAFISHEQKFVIAGDVLFSGSIGRSDLPGGSLPQLLKSIIEKILPLGDDYKIYPGHGPATSIGVEKRSNPFLQAQFLASNT